MISLEAQRDQHLSLRIPAKRNAALDGWRGIAILLVLFDHLQFALLHRYAMPWAQTGQHGVTIFFLLSGYLITTKLLEGPIHLKEFYLRRFFRLMPVAWVYLAAMLLFDRVMHAYFLSGAEVTASLLFYRNFFPGANAAAAGGAAGHFWSLSLEEQFYFVWPILLLLAGIRRCRWIALGGAIGCAIYRYFTWAHYEHNVLNGQTQVRADALLLGCLLALLVPSAIASPRIHSAAALWSKRLALPAFFTLLLCVARFHWLVPLYECAVIALLFAATILLPQSFFARLLASPTLVWLGTISYSLYVWQAFVMLPWTDTMRPLVICVALPVLTLGSYYLIERPMTRWGKSLTHRSVSSSGQSRFHLCGRLFRSHSGASLPVQQQ